MGADEIVIWTWPDANTVTTEEFTTGLPGIYKAVVTNTRTDCVDSSDIEVVVDTATIDNEISGHVRLFCSRPWARIFSVVDQESAFLEWSGPGFQMNNEDTIVVTQPGMYYLTSTLPSMCFDVDSFFVRADTLHPDLSLSGDTLSCGTPKVELTAVSSIDDVSYSWSGPYGFASTDSMPFVNAAGYYTLELTVTNTGCSTIDSILIVGDTLAPTVAVETDLFSCDDTTAMASAVSVDSIDQYIWLGPDMFSAMGKDVLLDRTGEFIIIAFAPNGCVGEDTFDLSSFDLVDSVSLYVDSISCLNPVGTHYVTKVNPNAGVSWYEGSTSSQSVRFIDDTLWRDHLRYSTECTRLSMGLDIQCSH